MKHISKLTCVKLEQMLAAPVHQGMEKWMGCFLPVTELSVAGFICLGLCSSPINLQALDMAEISLPGR